MAPVAVEALRQRLNLYGHRNWIVVADSAYPAHAASGIETIFAGADQIETLQTVLAMLASARHVTARVHLDQELEFICESDAPGVEAYRQQLAGLLEGEAVTALPHDEIICRLDHAGREFRVLIVKTSMTIPYTSVFLQLECAYWDDEREQRLRAAMRDGQAQGD